MQQNIRQLMRDNKDGFLLFVEAIERTSRSLHHKVMNGGWVLAA